MSEQEVDALSDLNAVAASELKSALATETRLLPEWKQAAIQLLESGMPQNLEPLRKLIVGEPDA